MTFTANWKEDTDNDNIPDEDEVKITFVSDHGFNEGTSPYETLQKPGETLKAPKPTDTDSDGVVFTGWNTEDGNLPATVPDQATEYVAVYKLDTNNDGHPDEGETKYSISYKEGAHEAISGTMPKGDDELLHNTEQTVSNTIPEADGWVFDHWTVEPADKDIPTTPGATFMMPESNVTFTANWKEDTNNDDIPDDTQNFKSATLKPYDTSIYSGGAQEDGFPELALRYEQGGRAVEDDVITAIVINGVRYDGFKTADLFDAVYWQDGDAVARPNDDEGGVYNAAVVLKNAAANAVAGSTEGQDGLLVGTDGHRVLAANYTVVIEASYGDGTNAIYNITINPSTLIVRYVNADDVLRPVASSEAELQAEAGKAAAVVPAGAVLYVNDDDERPVDRKSADIRLLSDEILDLADNRQQLLVDRGFQEALGMTSEQAAEAGYESATRYFDLVDYNNGNAWITSNQPTTVYMPLPKGTDQNTEFRLLHFKELHRENYYADVANAIATAPVETVSITVEGQYIKFNTATGKDAFSPFMLMWKTDDGNGNGGGSHDNDSTTGGSGTVADPYVVRLHGNWVHMDPNDIFKPISEPVPEGATPVTNPEWHQWKFILNNGTMLFNRWAYIRNPYAVGDQPREGWFYFNRDGIMQYGWYRDEATGKWYYAHRESDGMLGTLRYGWHHDDQDGRWYYLDPTTGEMLLGWRQIDGKWYYFNPYAPEVTWNYNEATGGWTYNGSASRPYGSMYQNEMTPDGYQVDGNGAWVQ